MRQWSELFVVAEFVVAEFAVVEFAVAEFGMWEKWIVGAGVTGCPP